MTINFIVNGTEAEISQKQYFQTSKSQRQIVNYISDYVFSTFCQIYRLSSVRLSLIGKSWKTHPEIFLKLSFSGSSHRPFYWKTHPLKLLSTYSVFFQFWGVTQTVLLENSSIRIFIYDIWYVTFGLDEFSSKTACAMPQTSPIDDWMSFPVKRSQKFPRIRVISQVSEIENSKLIFGNRTPKNSPSQNLNN